MTTFVSFAPQAQSVPPFQTPVTLDGATYNLIGWWNILGRWYFTINDQSGNNIFTGALTGSPDATAIYLAPGVFQVSTLLYRSSTGNFEVNP